MDPISLGVVAAAVIQKVLDRAEDGAVEAADSVVRRMIGWLGEHLHPTGRRALARVQDAPDSGKRIQELAAEIDAAAEQAEFAAELGRLMDEVERTGVDVQTVVSQSAVGHGNVQVANSGGDVRVSYAAGELSRPRPR